LALTLLGGGLGCSPSFADDERRAVGTRDWLSIPQVHQKLEGAGYRNIEGIVRERGSYEVRATARDGRRVRLEVDARSGEVVDRVFRGDRLHEAYGKGAGQFREYRDRRYEEAEGRDGRGREDHESGEGRTWLQNGVECNKRRCRDDLPAAPASAPPSAAPAAVR